MGLDPLWHLRMMRVKDAGYISVSLSSLDLKTLASMDDRIQGLWD